MISMHKEIKFYESLLNLFKGKSNVDYKIAENKIDIIKQEQIQLYEFFFIVNRRDNYLKDIKEINKKIIKIAGFSIEGLR